MLPAAAKARAEQEFASARTQQEAERAEQAMKDTAAALKEVMRLKVARPCLLTLLSLILTLA